MKADPHGGWRRVVPSPDPYSIVEASVIRTLVADGVIVIASGGGGVPVVDDGPRLTPKEGVVDKDLAAAILARDVEAPTLLILTDVPNVQKGFGTLYPEDLSLSPWRRPGSCSPTASSQPARWVRRLRRRCASSRPAVDAP